MRMVPFTYIVAGGAICLLSATSLVAETSPARPAEPASFNQCKQCHSAAPGLKPMIGPNLFGVVGSRAGSRSGYAFSNAMKASGIVWNAQSLDAFITSPQQVVRGTKMTYFGERDPDRRREIVTYLTTLK